MKTLWLLTWRGMKKRKAGTLLLGGAVAQSAMFLTLVALVGLSSVKTAVENAKDTYGEQMVVATGTDAAAQSLLHSDAFPRKGAMLLSGSVTVENNAAAVLLMLDGFCKDGEVIVSRGELVEIGGSFRIPEVMEKSGAHLREVGATNRTHLRDYAAAINENTRALLRVHTSNYRIVGFQSSVPLPELAALAHERGLPLFEDLGSGSFMDFSPYGLPNEPTVPSVLAGGADLVTFSGDKVLGGPQAGIIAGRKELVDRLKSNPLTRALRCDKLCLAALEATLRLYLDPDKARERIPTLRRICLRPEDLARRARALAARLRKALGGDCAVSVRPDVSRVGGGAFPQYDLPTSLVCLKPARISATALKNALLATDPPLLGRLEDDHFCLDPRTLENKEYPLLLRALRMALQAAESNHNRQGI